MPLSLQQLRTVLTTDLALEEALTTLQGLGFNTTAWQSGSVQRTMITMFASVYAKLTGVTDSLSRLAFNSSSIGAALTAFSDSQYDNQRIAATATVGTIDLIGGPAGPPYAVAIGDVVVSDDLGNRYQNITAGTVPASGTLSLSFQAEIVGTASNVANDTIVNMTTPLAGVTVSNPDPGSGTWITTLGTDDETDPVLALRNISKWGVLSFSDPAARYEHFIRTEVPNATRVEIDDDNPGGPGTVHIYLATVDGTPVLAADLVAAQNEADRVKNPTADITVFAAAPQGQGFSMTVNITSALNTVATQEAVEQSLRDYINGLPVGGTVFAPDTQGRMIFSELVGAVTDVPGVVQVSFSSPSANVDITAHEVMTVASITASYISS